MKIVVLGASGRAGSRIIAEALDRGHEVTGIARSWDQRPATPRLTLRAVDATDFTLASHLIGHDVVVSSMRFTNVPATTLLAAVKYADVRRLVVVGGSGSLEVSPGLQLVDTPDLPAIYLDEARAGRQFLNELKKEFEVDWTFISPSLSLDPGTRTGTYRIGGEQLLFDKSGRSYISMEDYAIALVDELERPQFSRKRFQVGY